MNRTLPVSIAAAFVFSCSLSSCSGSDETQKIEQTKAPSEPSATEVLTTTMNKLRVQNDSLKTQLASLEQTNRSNIARAADLETQLHDLQAKAAPPPSSLSPATAKTISEPVRPRNATDAYDSALRLFRSRNYGESASMLEQLLNNKPPVDLADNCVYWIGECAYAMKQYKEAIDQFRKVFAFNVSEKKDDAQIMIANSYYALGDKASAKKEYNKFLEKYPGSPYAKRARERLGKL